MKAGIASSIDTVLSIYGTWCVNRMNGMWRAVELEGWIVLSVYVHDALIGVTVGENDYGS